MPEKMTKEEVRVAQAIEQVRIVKELVQQASAERIAYDDESEEVKVKRPKKTGEKDKTKIENNKGTHSGYGLGGEETHFKKAVDPKEDISLTKTVQGIKGLNTQAALKWLQKAGKTKLTPQQVEGIERELSKLEKEPKTSVYSMLSLSNALGIPFSP